jgi:carbon-monoxide dehydrogenase small subunit
MAKVHVGATLNGNDVEFLCDTRQTLLQIIRDELHLTGTKEGCATGDCGACSVTVDGRLMCSCLVLGVEVQGKSIQTIEGMSDGEKLHPLQRKFLEHAALQCGICTPGVLIAARSLLERNPNPTETKCATGWRATCAAAPGTTRSSRRCSMPPVKCEELTMAIVITTPEKELKVVGTSPVRPDGVPKVTGLAQYGADFHLPGMLWGKILRSPHAHARIRSIDTSKAER